MFCRKSLFAAWAFLAVISANAVAEDWPEWRGPNRDGKSAETGLMKKWPADGPKKLWEAPMGEGYSCMAVADGRVYTQYQKNGMQGIVALDEKTGKQIWGQKTGDPYDNRWGNGPRSTPTVDGDRVYALDASGNLVCLETKDGAEVWRMNILKKFGAKNLQWGVSMSPLVDGERLIVNAGKSNGSSVVALNKRDGKVIWKCLDDKAGYSSPLTRTISSKRQIVIFTGAGVYGLVPETGKSLWHFPWSTRPLVHAATPIIKDDMVFISSGYNTGCAAVRVNLQKSDPVEELWRSRVIRSHFGSPILLGDCLYAFDDREFVCVEYETGNKLWGEKGYNKGAHFWADDMFYIVAEKIGDVVLAKASPQGFEEVSKMPGVLTGKCWTMPVVANGRLFVRDEEKMICYDIKAK